MVDPEGVPTQEQDANLLFGIEGVYPPVYSEYTEDS